MNLTPLLIRRVRALGFRCNPGGWVYERWVNGRLIAAMFPPDASGVVMHCKRRRIYSVPFKDRDELDLALIFINLRNRRRAWPMTLKNGRITEL